MNEQIRELFNKASVYAYEQNPGENSYGRPVDENKYEEDRYTKFAELIVREAGALLMSPEFIGRSDLDWSMVLNEHFGVEE